MKGEKCSQRLRRINEELQGRYASEIRAVQKNLRDNAVQEKPSTVKLLEAAMQDVQKTIIAVKAQHDTCPAGKLRQ